MDERARPPEDPAAGLPAPPPGASPPPASLPVAAEPAAGGEGSGEAGPQPHEAPAPPGAGDAAGDEPAAGAPAAQAPAGQASGAAPAGPLDVLFAVLFQPRSAFPALAARPPLGLAAAVVLAVSALDALRLAAEGAELLGRLGAPAAPGALVPLALALWVPLGAALWYGGAGAWQLAAELLGGRGSGRATLALTGLAQLPAAFLPPLGLLGRWLGDPVWLGLLEAAVVVWSLGLAVWAVRAAHGLPPGRAAAAVLVPVLAAIALVTLGAVLVVAALWRLAPGSPPVP